MDKIIKRYIGVLGLIFLFCLILTLTQNTISGFMSFLGFLVGCFAFYLLLSVVPPFIIYFVSLAIGKKIQQQIIFYIFGICSLLVGIMLFVGIINTP